MKSKKRGIALLLCALMTIMSVSVFAADNEDIMAAMNENITSANVKMTMEMGVSKISDELKTVFGVTGDVPKMSADYDMALKASEDELVMQMAMLAVVKIAGMADTNVEAYMDMDMRDAENPKMKYITKTDAFDKYIVMDYNDIPGAEAMLESLASYSPEKIKEMNEKLAEILPDKEFVLEDGVYTMTITEEEMKAAVKDMMTVMEDVFVQIFKGAKEMTGAAEGSDEELAAEFKETADQWFAALEGVKLFADDAVVVKATMDDDKHLATMDIEINLATNLNELIAAVKPLLETAVPDTADLTEEEKTALEEQKKAMDDQIAKITKENSDVEAYLKLSMEMSNVNGEVTVTFPELTDENSVDMKDLMIDESKINVLFNGIRVQFDDVEPIIEGERTLVPLRKFCNVIGITDENIGFEDGVITIKNGETTLVLTIDEIDVTKTVGETTETIKLDVPATIKNDRTLVPLRFVSENFDCNVTFEPIEGSTGSIISITK